MENNLKDLTGYKPSNLEVNTSNGLKTIECAREFKRYLAILL
jgi:hypothetical protein